MNSEAAKDFTASFGFVIFFITLVLFLDLLAGDKATIWFLLLVLFSMIIVNADAFTALLGRFSKV